VVFRSPRRSPLPAILCYITFGTSCGSVCYEMQLLESVWDVNNMRQLVLFSYIIRVSYGEYLCNAPFSFLELVTNSPISENLWVSGYMQ